MLDAQIIASCIASREAYDRVRHYVDPKEFSPQGGVWWPIVEQWYKADPSAKRCDAKIIRDRGKRELPENHLDTLLGWYDDLPEPASPENTAAELLALQKQQRGLEIQHAISSEKDPDKLAGMLDEYSKLVRATSLSRSELQWSTFDTMLETLDEKNKIPIAPKKLNDRLKGGGVPGDFILVYARPEAGKTMFVVNMACGFLKMGYKVLYIGNEESTDKTLMRVTCNLLNRTEDAVKANAEAAHTAAKKRGLDKLRIGHMSPGTVAEIELLVEEFEPDVLVVDQIRNLEGPGQKMTQKLEAVGGQLRAMIGRHGVLGVFVTQAGDHTERMGQEPPVWLTMSDIDNSRTGLPGHADLIIGVGVNHDMKSHNTRAISLPKNKLGNDHEGFTVTVDEDRSRVK